VVACVNRQCVYTACPRGRNALSFPAPGHALPPTKQVPSAGEATKYARRRRCHATSVSGACIAVGACCACVEMLRHYRRRRGLPKRGFARPVNAPIWCLLARRDEACPEAAAVRAGHDIGILEGACARQAYVSGECVQAACGGRQWRGERKREQRQAAARGRCGKCRRRCVVIHGGSGMRKEVVYAQVQWRRQCAVGSVQCGMRA